MGTRNGQPTMNIHTLTHARPHACMRVNTHMCANIHTHTQTCALTISTISQLLRSRGCVREGDKISSRPRGIVQFGRMIGVKMAAWAHSCAPLCASACCVFSKPLNLCFQSIFILIPSILYYDLVCLAYLILHSCTSTLL